MRLHSQHACRARELARCCTADQIASEALQIRDWSRVTTTRLQRDPSPCAVSHRMLITVPAADSTIPMHTAACKELFAV